MRYEFKEEGRRAVGGTNVGARPQSRRVASQRHSLDHRRGAWAVLACGFAGYFICLASGGVLFEYSMAFAICGFLCGAGFAMLASDGDRR